MAFKVNYGLERAERNRAKQAKKEAKALARKSGSSNADANVESQDEVALNVTSPTAPVSNDPDA